MADSFPDIILDHVIRHFFGGGVSFSIHTFMQLDFFKKINMTIYGFLKYKLTYKSIYFLGIFIKEAFYNVKLRAQIRYNEKA